MKRHTSLFLKHYSYVEQDCIICQYCEHRIAVDIHHIIFRSQGGKDEINNLIALCRTCHEAAHRKTISAKTLKERIASITNVEGCQ